MKLADKIIMLRKQAGWSQEELANQLGVSRQAISKWESSQSLPDIDKIISLAKLFNTTTDDLLLDDHEIRHKVDKRKISLIYWLLILAYVLFYVYGDSGNGQLSSGLFVVLIGIVLYFVLILLIDLLKKS